MTVLFCVYLEMKRNKREKIKGYLIIDQPVKIDIQDEVLLLIPGNFRLCKA